METASKHIKAVLFDLDGTLINSEEIDILIFENLMWDQLKLKVSADTLSKHRGTPVPKILAQYAPQEKVDELVKAWLVYKTRFQDRMALYPGVREVLKELRKAGLKLAVVTSQTAEECVLAQSQLRLDGMFDTWVNADQVHATKPDPEPVFTALSELNVAPGEAVMVGDTFNDLEAGKRAGAFIGAALWGFGDNELLLSYQPDFIFQQVTEIRTLAQFADRMN